MQFRELSLGTAAAGGERQSMYRLIPSMAQLPGMHAAPTATARDVAMDFRLPDAYIGNAAAADRVENTV